MIYLCHQTPNHILSPEHSDQLFHALIKSSAAKLLKISMHSEPFQMHEQRGHFNDIGTCIQMKFGQYNSTSLILSKEED